MGRRSQEMIKNNNGRREMGYRKYVKRRRICDGRLMERKENGGGMGRRGKILRAGKMSEGWKRSCKEK